MAITRREALQLGGGSLAALGWGYVAPDVADALGVAYAAGRPGTSETVQLIDDVERFLNLAARTGADRADKDADAALRANALLADTPAGAELLKELSAYAGAIAREDTITPDQQREFADKLDDLRAKADEQADRMTGRVLALYDRYNNPETRKGMGPQELAAAALIKFPVPREKAGDAYLTMIGVISAARVDSITPDAALELSAQSAATTGKTS